MKIAIVHAKVIQGGAEKIIVFFAHYLKKQGHEVDVITLHLRQHELNADFIKGTNFITPPGFLKQLCAVPFFRKMFGFPILYFMLKARINKYDIIHANNFPSHWVAGLLAPEKTVWQCNEPPLKVDAAHIKSVGLMEYLLSFIYTGALDKKIVKKIAAIVVLDNMNAERIKNIYGRKDAIINYIGIDEDYFKKPAAAKEVFRKNHLNPKDRHLICAGNLVPGKNQQLLIKALKTLETGGIKNLKLILVGRGPDRERLEVLAGELGVLKNVIFKGFVTNKELRELYSIADINLFPAVKQSWGLTPFEAAAQKVMSIVSNDCGTAEVIKKQEIGRVIPPVAEKFAEEIRSLLKAAAKRKQLGKKAYLFVRKEMTWKKYTAIMEKLFETIIIKNKKVKTDGKN